MGDRDNRISFRINRKMLKFAFFIGIFSGLVGMFVDTDHLFCGRCAHIPLLILAMCVIMWVVGYCIARVRGLSSGMVLEKKRVGRR